VRVGELLAGAEIVSAEHIAQAQTISLRTALPIGRILAELGLIKPTVVRAATLAQALINDNLLHRDLATAALKLVHVEDVNLEEALQQLGWRAEYYERINAMADMLLDTGCVTSEQMKAAFEVAFASGLPLLRVLVLRQTLRQSLAHAALESQTLLQEGAIDRNQAMQLIVDAATSSDVHQSVVRPGNKVRLGELLVCSAVITELDLLSAVEDAIMREDRIGEVLIRAGLISNRILDAALRVQYRLHIGKIEWEQGLRLLAEAKERGEQDWELSESGGSVSGIGRPLVQDRETVGLADWTDLEKGDGTAARKQVLSAMQELELQKQNLAFKVVHQHEEIKSTLARELHDTTIADLMMLKRYLSGDKRLSLEETIDIIDHVIRQLRDICYDFSPRQIRDLGLQASLKDLLERMQARTAMQCRFICEGELPQLPDAVQLHLFRIVQECLNNCEKYSGATEISATLQCSDRRLCLTVTDNGKGFDPEEQTGRTLEGGTGMGSMQERCDLIRIHFPAKLSIDSHAGVGSNICLEISLAS